MLFLNLQIATGSKFLCVCCSSHHVLPFHELQIDSTVFPVTHIYPRSYAMKHRDPLTHMLLTCLITAVHPVSLTEEYRRRRRRKAKSAAVPSICLRRKEVRPGKIGSSAKGFV